MNEIQAFEVGGCVRDELLGVKSKDVDFVVVADSFAHMEAMLFRAGLRIVQSKPEFGVIRAVGNFRGHKGGLDFVHARKDGPSSDGRHPDFTTPGTLADDLARRDFTVNAIAKAADGSLIDPHGGQSDIMLRQLRFVGDAKTRLSEDSLRALRAIRFRVTKGFQWTHSTFIALATMDPATLAAVSVERRREELLKCFQHDTMATLRILMHEMAPEFTEAVFADGLWLMPTLKDA